MDLYEKRKFNDRIDKIIEKLKNLIQKRNYIDQITEKNIITKIEIESNLILKQMYLEMRENLFEKYPFYNNIENQNLFDDLGLRARILNECKFKINSNKTYFKTSENSNLFSPKNNKIFIGVGIAGIVWSFIEETILPLLLPIVLILMYKFSKDIVEKKKKSDFDNFFENIKKDLKIWLNDIESFFIKEVKKTFIDFNKDN